MENTTTATIRTRIHLGRTIKEGWHYESTTELTAPVDMPATTRDYLLTAEMERARELGAAERDECNRLDRELSS